MLLADVMINPLYVWMYIYWLQQELQSHISYQEYERIYQYSTIINTYEMYMYKWIRYQLFCVFIQTTYLILQKEAWCKMLTYSETNEYIMITEQNMEKYLIESSCSS